MRRRVALLIAQIAALALTLPLAVLTAMLVTRNVLVAVAAPLLIYAGLMYLILRPVPRLVAELTDSEAPPHS